MSVFSNTAWFNTHECWVCGVMFAITQDTERRLRNDGGTLFCPKGCHLSFGEADITKVKREKLEIEQRMQAQINQERHARLVAEKAAKTATAAKRKVERRIAHGVCPCCNKTFADLSHHMIENHKDFRLPGGKAQKQIAGAA